MSQYLEYSLQFGWLFVPEIEEAVSRVVSVKAELDARCRVAALGS